jgi:hypothetical protein
LPPIARLARSSSLLLAPFGMALVGTGTSILTGLSPTHGFAGRRRCGGLHYERLLTVIPALMVFVAPGSRRTVRRIKPHRLAGITTRLFVRVSAPLTRLRRSSC